VNTSLERYFEQQVTLPEETGKAAFTETERAFLERYMGSDFQSALASQGLSRPAAVESLSGPLVQEPPARADGQDAGTDAGAQAGPDDDPDRDLEARLRQARELKLVGFRVGGQELSVPIAQVQEVIRAVPVTRIPAAPPHILGIMNLRGRVVPLLDMAGLLGLAPAGECRFIVVCRRRDILLGLFVEAIAAMHQARGEDVEWGVEARVGVTPDLIAGLLLAGEFLVKILSVDSLFQKVLKS
jgi:purine-binding chemotaxis protein CheW